MTQSASWEPSKERNRRKERKSYKYWRVCYSRKRTLNHGTRVRVMGSVELSWKRNVQRVVGLIVQWGLGTHMLISGWLQILTLEEAGTPCRGHKTNAHESDSCSERKSNWEKQETGGLFPKNSVYINLTKQDLVLNLTNIFFEHLLYARAWTKYTHVYYLL